VIIFKALEDTTFETLLQNSKKHNFSKKKKVNYEKKLLSQVWTQISLASSLKIGMWEDKIEGLTNEKQI